MDLRGVREQLGRVKPYYLKNDMARALGAAVLGVKGVVEIGVAPSTEIRGLIREAVQLLSRDQSVKTLLKVPLSYLPGQERALLAQVAALYKNLLEEQGREDRKSAFARKQKLDQQLNLGMRLLAQGQVSEADAAFSEALQSYKDEHVLFKIIGKGLVDAGEMRRATPYLRKGLEVLPEDASLAELLMTVTQAKAKEAS